MRRHLVLIVPDRAPTLCMTSAHSQSLETVSFCALHYLDPAVPPLCYDDAVPADIVPNPRLVSARAFSHHLTSAPCYPTYYCCSMTSSSARRRPFPSRRSHSRSQANSDFCAGLRTMRPSARPIFILHTSSFSFSISSSVPTVRSLSGLVSLVHQREMRVYLTCLVLIIVRGVPSHRAAYARSPNSNSLGSRGGTILPQPHPQLVNTNASCYGCGLHHSLSRS
ncbi:hypothetical protein MSAN_00275800 [Mycena sanguinolenta]|uniref:Uncharacterized protein n=1 Tax=Mycena sanguinolenta TaxID=230812 RepID=A0A8H6ZJK0_9AGAR|nr:hypothetical protein MSAN_00275800 [Mycena sanguinolenta]